MNKNNVEKALRRELKVVNEVIDARIIRGFSYVQESRRHRAILSQLSNLKRSGNLQWFSRAFSII